MYSVDWETRIITIPKSDLSDIGDNRYELDLEEFHRNIRILEYEFDEGLSQPEILRYNSPVVLSGTTYVGVVEIINDYKVMFEDGLYFVPFVGANTNLQDNMILNGVVPLPNNSAGNTITKTGSGLSDEEHDKLMGMVDDIFNHVVECGT